MVIRQKGLETWKIQWKAPSTLEFSGIPKPRVRWGRARKVLTSGFPKRSTMLICLMIPYTSFILFNCILIHYLKIFIELSCLSHHFYAGHIKGRGFKFHERNSYLLGAWSVPSGILSASWIFSHKLMKLFLW